MLPKNDKKLSKTRINLDNAVPICITGDRCSAVAFGHACKVSECRALKKYIKQIALFTQRDAQDNNSYEPLLEKCM